MHTSFMPFTTKKMQTIVTLFLIDKQERNPVCAMKKNIATKVYYLNSI